MNMFFAAGLLRFVPTDTSSLGKNNPKSRKEHKENKPTLGPLKEIPKELRKWLLPKLNQASKEQRGNLTFQVETERTLAATLKEESDSYQLQIEELKKEFIQKGGTEKAFFALLNYKNEKISWKNEGYLAIQHALLPTKKDIENGHNRRRHAIEVALEEEYDAKKVEIAKQKPQYEDLLKHFRRLQELGTSNDLGHDNTADMACHDTTVSTELRRLIDFNTAGAGKWLTARTFHALVEDFNAPIRRANREKFKAGMKETPEPYRPILPTKHHLDQQNKGAWKSPFGPQKAIPKVA